MFEGTLKVECLTLDIVSYHAGTPVRVEIKKIGLRFETQSGSRAT